MGVPRCLLYVLPGWKSVMRGGLISAAVCVAYRLIAVFSARRAVRRDLRFGKGRAAMLMADSVLAEWWQCGCGIKW